jgi:hypothetical protein
VKKQLSWQLAQCPTPEVVSAQPTVAGYSTLFSFQGSMCRWEVAAPRVKNWQYTQNDEPSQPLRQGFLITVTDPTQMALAEREWAAVGPADLLGHCKQQHSGNTRSRVAGNRWGSPGAGRQSAISRSPRAAHSRERPKSRTVVERLSPYVSAASLTMPARTRTPAAPNNIEGSMVAHLSWRRPSVPTYIVPYMEPDLSGCLALLPALRLLPCRTAI